MYQIIPNRGFKLMHYYYRSGMVCSLVTTTRTQLVLPISSTALPRSSVEKPGGVYSRQDSSALEPMVVQTAQLLNKKPFMFGMW